jgi:alpha-glucosidase
MSYFDFKDSVHHDGSSRYVCPQGGEQPQFGDEVIIRLRAAVDAPLERVLLRIVPDGEQLFLTMQEEATSLDLKPACRWWRVHLRLAMPVTTYRFLLFTSEGAWWYNGGGLHRHLLTDAEDFRLLAGYQAPEWVRSSVFYQIFPDRFADGNPQNNVKDGEFAYWGYPARSSDWGEMPASGSRAASAEFFGGDLAGIEGHLDYLQRLGANALYINPVFTAYSNHRYDVADYEQVDAHLGGNQALQSLRKETSLRDIRMILDIVPNHCGIQHAWFKAALADPDAPTAEYFTFHHYPDDYACWLGEKGLPKLNYNSQALRQKMYAAENSIFRRWLKPPFALDGWRLDVANMLARQGANQMGLEVGRGIRNAVKMENPQAYLLGENFFDGTEQLQGDLWDASMNYSGFTMPLWYWLKGFYAVQRETRQTFIDPQPWTTQALVDSWQAFRSGISWTIARQQFNLLGSHDTARIKSLLGGNPALNRLAVGLLMTYVGVPCVYYGDEIGLYGTLSAQMSDPSTRACMDWDPGRWDQDLFMYYEQLIALRRSSPALIRGGFQVLLVETDTLVFLRDADEEQMIVIAHRGDNQRPAVPIFVAHGAISDGTQWEEVISGRRATVSSGFLSPHAVSTGIEIWRNRPG